MIGGAVGIAGHISIADDVVITGYSAISHSIAEPRRILQQAFRSRKRTAGAGWWRASSAAARSKSACAGWNAASVCRPCRTKKNMTEAGCNSTSRRSCERLPHRYPFLLVDRVLECRPGQSIRALKNVTYNEPFFPGHFPGRPVMPGVMIIEALAQAAGILCFVTATSFPTTDTRFYFVGIDKARFRRPVVPGDQLHADGAAAALAQGHLALRDRARGRRIRRWRTRR